MSEFTKFEKIYIGINSVIALAIGLILIFYGIYKNIYYLKLFGFIWLGIMFGPPILGLIFMMFEYVFKK